jgi:hemolysin III
VNLVDEVLARPRLRGVSHQWAFAAAVVAGAVLTATARDPLPAAVYAVSLCAMFGTSALYHRGRWSPARLAVMRGLDHSMIFVLVAGTFTPIVASVVDGTFGTVLLIVVWSGALAGIALTWLWASAPRGVVAGVYVALGWVGVLAMPDIARNAGVAALLLLLAGGILYTIGAVVYARQRPDPLPEVFGFHEVFHVFVIAAAAAHVGAVAICIGS